MKKAGRKYTAAPVNLTTAGNARYAFDILKIQLNRVSAEQGRIGSLSSRLSVATNTLSIARENYVAAESQIMDVDTAEEAANLVRTKILQQAGTAVLAQANVEPQLALRLLGLGG